MKVFSVCGITQSGKTTTIEHIIRELSGRGKKVGSVKEIHYEAFAIDSEPSSNTFRHRSAGSQLVTARGYRETDVLFPAMLDMRKILSFYDRFDYVVLEGVSDIPVPTIVTAHAPEDLEQKWSDYIFCVSGRFSEGLSEYKGVPAISAVSDAASLVNLVERKVYDLLPCFDPKCCGVCGCDCRELGVKILRGEAKRGDCAADRGVELSIDGRRIDMVPFVQSILRRTVLGVVGELDGYREGAGIRIEFR